MLDYPDDKNCNKFSDYLLENYVAFDSKVTPDMWAGFRREEMAQNCFTLILTNSSMHLIQTFSYLTSCILLLQLSTTLLTPN